MLVVPHTGERHVDQRAIICLEGDPQVDFDGTVGLRGDPVAAAREHAAAKTVAVEDPPVTGKIDSVPRGVAPMSWVAAVARRSVMR